MDEEAVEPQAEPIEQMIEEAQQADSVQEDNNDQAQRPEKPMIPLSALQKVREKKKEVELELQWQRQRTAELEARLGQIPQKEEEDSSRYESATREDLSRSQEEAIRKIEERLWIRQNPDKYDEINEYLPMFLKQRPHLAAAIDLAPNRLEEAYVLMKALTPKQQTQLKKDASSPRKEAPNAPTSVPKAAALNDAVDVMNMTEAEFAQWRQSKRKRR